MEDPIGSRRIYEGRIINLRIDSVRMPDGRIREREIVEHRGAVAIVAVDANNMVHLVRQFRSGPGRELLEIPAGTREKDEPLEECLQRELQEEIGQRAGKLEPLVGFYTAPGFCTEYLDVYLATELVPSRLPGDDDEFISVDRVDISELDRLIQQGVICDAKSIVGVLMFLTRWRRG